MKIIKCIFFITIIFGVSFIQAVQNGENNAPAETLIAGKYAALKLAIEYLGVPGLDSLLTEEKAEKMVTLVTMVDSTTPYLAQQINGKQAWKIVFDSVIMDYEEANYEKEKEFAKKIDIYIDKEGRFLKGIIRSIISKNEVYYETESKEAERQIRETYHGFPAKMPKINLYQALVKCKLNTLYAPAIFVNYVNCSSRTNLINGIRPVWVLWMKGVGDIFGFPIPEDYEYETDCSRRVIDAETGAILMNNNVPCPKKIKK